MRCPSGAARPSAGSASIPGRGQRTGTTRRWYAPLRPDPPAPMQMAGMPRERGMLASVDAQSSRERIPRWASTERMRASRGASGASLAPGLLPISLIFAVTFAPMTRAFSTSSARATAACSATTSCSIFSSLSERISILARAAAGIALMLTPPSTMPTLTDTFGVDRGSIGF